VQDGVRLKMKMREMHKDGMRCKVYTSSQREKHEHDINIFYFAFLSIHAKEWFLERAGGFL